MIAEVLDAVAQSEDGAAPLVEAAVKEKVRALTDRFPIYRDQRSLTPRCAVPIAAPPTRR